MNGDPSTLRHAPQSKVSVKPPSLGRRIIERFLRELRYLSIQLESWYRWHRKPRTRPHRLPGNLVVSLTSYPVRFSTLPKTLRCLLRQSVKPDHLILWIAYQDKPYLTKEITNLEKEGLEIRYCEDIKSYKKVIPSLSLFPHAFIVTADDDVYYDGDWLAELQSSYVPSNPEIVCHRARMISLNEAGVPKPYLEWKLYEDPIESEPLLLPNGIGGVLYPPSIFHIDVLREDIFMHDCPEADDLWLYWMARLTGTRYRKVSKQWKEYCWKGAQAHTLYSSNVLKGNNDRQIKLLTKRYGFPNPD